MMKPVPFFKLIAGIAMASLILGCTSLRNADLAKASLSETQLTEGYSLLSHLLKDESNLDKIFVLKDASPATSHLIKKIAQSARDAHKRIQSLATEKPSLVLKTPSLPMVESKTRDAIAKSTAGTLLENSGTAFELRLLLTQVQATNYATHLAAVLASSEPNPVRQAFLKKIVRDFKKLNEETVSQVAKLN